MPAGTEAGAVGEHVCPKADSSSMTISKSKSVYRLREEGLHADTAQSTLIVSLKSVIGGLTSIILIVLITINLQFRGLLLFPEASSWKRGRLHHGHSLVIM